ncbi:HNH endonuclease signature motif containing protein [Chloroflexota bacterium]
MDESKTHEDENGYLRFNDSNKLFHRWVMERKVGRSLKKGEIVHHINGNKRDNTDVNLAIITPELHYQLHIAPQMEARKEAEIIERLTPIHEAKAFKALLTSFAWIGIAFLIIGLLLNIILGRVATIPIWISGVPFLLVSLIGWFLNR